MIDEWEPLEVVTLKQIKINGRIRHVISHDINNQDNQICLFFNYCGESVILDHNSQLWGITYSECYCIRGKMISNKRSAKIKSIIKELMIDMKIK